MLATLSETFWVLVLALIVLFAFFVAALAVLWVAHAFWDARHRDPHDRAVIRARERRGF
jgi:hypothetical protein